MRENERRIGERIEQGGGRERERVGESLVTKSFRWRCDGSIAAILHANPEVPRSMINPPAIARSLLSEEYQRIERVSARSLDPLILVLRELSIEHLQLHKTMADYCLKFS